MPIQIDHAYVIPPGATMTITNGHLRLVARQQGRGLHLPIDALLSSLAAARGSAAVGVILSGAGSDGSRGLEAIKEVGGITFAQDSDSAQVASMPEHAVETGLVDFVLAPEEIADQLGRLGLQMAQHPDETPRTASPSSKGEDEALAKILGMLQRRTGVDFHLYRRGTLHRRILRRMLTHRQDAHTEYLAQLRLDPAELDLLYEELLIGVTRFFRDKDVFTALQATAFPAMMATHRSGAALRVWVPGCASGEEAYSLAMALLEFQDAAADGPPIQIFGTDLSEVAIAKARAGIYPEAIKANVSPDRLRRFFVDERGGYRITKAVRDLCVFSRQNVTRDPPFSHLDLISCRNVFIYLEPELQRRVLPIFHYALKADGVLLLGAAESVGAPSEYFEILDKPNRIYRRRPTGRAPHFDFGVTTGRPIAGGIRPHAAARPSAAFPSIGEIAQEADRVVFAPLAPPGVVITERMEILHVRGDTTGFLALVPGAASLDLSKLARPELRHAVARRRSRVGSYAGHRAGDRNHPRG